MAADILVVVAEKLRRHDYGVSNLFTAYDLKWMETELRRVHELLKEDPGLEMNCKELRKWVRDLIHAAQNIEDIVDNFDFNLERRQQRMGCMGSAFFAVKGKVARYKIVAEVKQVMEKKSQICESMPKKQVFGFDKDVDSLVKLLVEGNDSHPLYMFIVGPCGAGKTTFVKEVYDSDAVKKKFPNRSWFRGNTSESILWSPTRLRPRIRGGNLIVLDINLTCDRNINFREDFISLLKQTLPDVWYSYGSRVVVTCNDKKDAGLFGEEIVVHEVGMLSSEEKWKLFLNTWDFDATTAGISLSSGMLEEIVRRQMHLPSEIVNLGDLLSKENRKSSALSNIMLDHPHYYQVDGPERTLSKIASSFNLLDSSWKLCFLYCSLFPKGFEIPTRRLIELWHAEGWFRLEDEWSFYPAQELLQRTVGPCFGELSHLGMIQVEYSYLRPGHPFHFGVKRIRLESPVWDFAAMKAMQYNLSHKIDNEGPPDSRSSSSNARGLALHSSGIYNHLFHDQKVSLPNLRFLMCFPQLTVIGGEVTFPTSRFKLLRVLDLEDMYFITQLSEEIGELVHLRYLGLRGTGLYSLPNSIGNLKNLRSLDIRGTRVKPIPTAIQKLKQLEFLYMDMDDGSTDNDPLDLSSLNGLRVLSVIRAGPWMPSLYRLTKLGICGDLLNYEDIIRLIVDSTAIEILRLGFGFGDIIQEGMLAPPNIRSLYLEKPLQKMPGPDKFPKYLKKLCLKWSLLEQDPMPTLGQLNILVTLKLRCGSFLGKKMVCSADRFRNLIFLELSLLDGLEEWAVEKGAMPKLQRLVIRLCNRLKELPQGLLHLHRIEKLEVAGMPDTFNARLQYNKGEDWDKIKHIKSVTVDGIQMAASSSSPSSSSQPYREISEIVESLG